jgi:uncharacterized membrane protein YdjX (TVP38/TMEM64 family)
MSLVAGLSRMPRRVFLGASVVGTAPIVVVYAYAGALSRAVGSVLPGVIILIAIGATAWIWYRTRQPGSAAFGLRESAERHVRP